MAGEVEFSAEAGVDLRAWRLRWYDHWLKGESNGVADDPPVMIYVMGTGDDRKSDLRPASSTAASGEAEQEWPLRRARPRAYFLNGRRHPHDDGS